MYMDDLAALDLLSEDAIVDQLQNRYERSQIYTYIGDILVAVNPFTNLGLYTGMVSKFIKIFVEQNLIKHKKNIIFLKCSGAKTVQRPSAI